MNEDVHPSHDGDPSVVDDGEATYRGFLFADLRGYTAFVERHGSEAAADLLDAYRELVRGEVARHAGAEIRTEGDSFYIVFGSARRAVACALAIVEAADRASGERPERPVRIGIGINAGETVLRAEGFVGSAVNLAARVCAEARQGEVLVTGAVRDVLGATPDLQLVPKGTRRLKGIARPVALFAVRRGAATEARSNGFARLRWLPIAAVLAVAVLAGGGWAVLSGIAREDVLSSPSPEASVSVQPSANTSAAPVPDPTDFPTAAELELLRVVGPAIEPHCERAEEDDRPIMFVDAASTQFHGFTLEDRVVALIGIGCNIPGAEAPDTFHMWATRQVGDLSAVDVGGALLANRAGRDGILPGDCSDGPAYELWEVGNVGGRLLCRDVSGDAVVEWSYDGHAIFGRAVRRDGDLASLLRWWTEEARLLRP